MNQSFKLISCILVSLNVNAMEKRFILALRENTSECKKAIDVLKKLDDVNLEFSIDNFLKELNQTQSDEDIFALSRKYPFDVTPFEEAIKSLDSCINNYEKILQTTYMHEKYYNPISKIVDAIKIDQKKYHATFMKMKVPELLLMKLKHHLAIADTQENATIE